MAKGVRGALLHLTDFGVAGTLTIGGLGIRRAKLSRVHVEYRGGGDDALTLERRLRKDRVLLEDCEVRGGGDGVMINAVGVGCSGAASSTLDRGIFANPDFVIENSTVQGCGGYGMKTRSGCSAMANNIQAGPWDGHQEFGGMSAMDAGMDAQIRAMMGGMGGFGMGGDDDDDDDRNEFGFTQDETMDVLAGRGSRGRTMRTRCSPRCTVDTRRLLSPGVALQNCVSVSGFAFTQLDRFMRIRTAIPITSAASAAAACRGRCLCPVT